LYAQQQRRISRPIDSSQRFPLLGHVNPAATRTNDRGRVAPTLEIPYVTLQFALTAEQKADRDALIAAQQDRSSPLYHQWLTPQQYADRFGVSQADIDQVTAWLQNQGLTVIAVAQGRDAITFSGQASQIESAFQTEIHDYVANGETHFANATDPSVPAALSSVVLAIRGLHDFRLHPQIAKPKFTSQVSGLTALAPNDFATIYDVLPAYAAGYDGTGQTVVVGGQSDINLSDIQLFQTTFGLPSNPPQQVLVGTRDPGSDDIDEANLDLEWVSATARKASIIFANSYNVMDAVTYAIDHNLGTVISLSYGSCEPENTQSDALFLRTYAQRANMQGITWVNATGDNGAADCADAKNPGASVDLPSSIPEITGMGGTQFQEGAGQYWNAANDATGASVLSYIPETTWNDTATYGSPSATGGGASIYFAQPSWQVGPGVPADGARHVPDIALNASPETDPYLIYSQGKRYGIGGTSAPTPAFAGLVAVLNQYLLATGQQKTAGLGNINPQLYALAQASPTVFHDITTGNNGVTYSICQQRGPCLNEVVAGYSAGVGYDQTTGLGSLDVWKLLTCWSGSCTSVSPSPTVSGLTDAAAFQQVYSPGMIMAAFGSGLSPSSASARNVPLPQVIAGVSATVNGETAPLYYVSPNQVNLQVPWDIPAGPATLTINTSAGPISKPFTVASASPGIFADGNRQVMPNPDVVINHVATVYLAGGGPVSPSIATGAAPASNVPLALLPAPKNLTLTVGGVPASTTCQGACFVGIPYGLVGVTQVNFQVANGTPLGLQPVVVTVDGVQSPPAYVTVTQ
jgi:uncharacterized protein (TIGR03437 family)